jgi:hypothetical protein
MPRYCSDLWARQRRRPRFKYPGPPWIASARTLPRRSSHKTLRPQKARWDERFCVLTGRFVSRDAVSASRSPCPRPVGGGSVPLVYQVGPRRVKRPGPWHRRASLRCDRKSIGRLGFSFVHYRKERPMRWPTAGEAGTQRSPLHARRLHGRSQPQTLARRTDRCAREGR